MGNDFSPTGFLAIGVGLTVTVFFLGYFCRRFLGERKVRRAEVLEREMIERAKHEAEVIQRDAQLSAKETLYKARTNAEEEVKRKQSEWIDREAGLARREAELDRKVDILSAKAQMLGAREGSVAIREEKITGRERELDELIAQEKVGLTTLAGMSEEEARQALLSRLEREVQCEASLMIKRIEESAREEADRRAKNIIALAIQRCAAEQTAESTVTVVALGGDDMKGRIIGKEGRNIRALELATGVDFLIDDCPDAVIISGFDPFRREIAKRSLEKLLADGRIHPARIEEVVEKVKREMDVIIKEEGEKMIVELGIQGSIHPELVKLVGRLKYRTSYGQNVLLHIQETTHLMGVMASELGLDFHLARRIGLLHDIGKAISHDVEGPHAVIGADLAKKYGESDIVVNAIGAHHEDMEPVSIYAVLAVAADAISASRPGARGDTFENYIKRLKKLEEIADAYPGVEKSYAISAGRELRVIVNPVQVNDETTYALARELRQKIEQGLEFPGQIKVTVIREMRAVEFAK